MSQNDAASVLFCQESLDDLEECIGKDTLRTLLATLPGECAELLKDLEKALANDDLPVARKVAHSIKGMAANYAATAIADIAREIEMNDLSIEQSKSRTIDLREVVTQTEDWIVKFA